MTKLRAVALVALALVASACTTKENTNTTTTTTPPPADVFTGTYTLQGFVADATTGARVGGGDLQVFLIQGATVRTPTRLNSGATDPLLGEYAFAGIPADYNTGNKRYKVVAVKPGYQRFEGEVVFTVADGTFHDSVYNVIGNIYMFPLGATAPSVTYTVTFNGKPVPNATVLLDPAPNASDPLYNTARAIASTTGYLASLSATTDANGVATFPGANLALGGAYSVQVLPVVFTEPSGNTVQLRRFDSGTNFLVGLSDLDQRIAMVDEIFASIYVVSASNVPVGQVNTAGTLTLTFNAPVILRNGTGFTAGLTGGTGVLGAPPVTATLSADGRTLTLAPQFATPLGAGDTNVSISYGNGTAFLEMVDYPNIFGGVFNLSYRDGGAVSGVVQMRAP